MRSFIITRINLIFLCIIKAVRMAHNVISRIDITIPKKLSAQPIITFIRKVHSKKLNKNNPIYYFWPFLIPYLAAYIFFCVLLYLKTLSVIYSRGIWNVLDDLPRLLMRAIEIAPTPSGMTIVGFVSLFGQHGIQHDNYYAWIILSIILIFWISLCIWWYKQPKFLSGIILFIYTSIVLSPLISLVAWCFSTR